MRLKVRGVIAREGESKLLIELAAGLFIYIRATRYLGIEEFWNQGPVKRVLDRLRLSWL